MGFIEEDDFTSAYAEQLGYRKADNFILLEADSEVASLIPEDFARENRGISSSKKRYDNNCCYGRPRGCSNC